MTPRRRHTPVSILFVVAIGFATLATRTAAADTPEQTAALARTCDGTDPAVTVETVDYVSGGETVRACVAYLAGSSPDTLVTFTHGAGHTVQASWVEHISRVVKDHDVLAVASNYRDNFGFPTLRGAQDTIAITRQLLADPRFPDIEHKVLYSVSMGASIGGTALAETVDAGQPIWSHWVVAEGVSNLFESYAEAAAVGASGNAFAKNAAEGMERDTGGTPLTVPDEYRLRSPIFRATSIADSLETAAFVHALADGLVGFHQGASMAAALCAAGVPTAFDPILVGSGGKDDTTLLSHVGLQDLNNATVDFAGHGSEPDFEHPVVAQSFARLDQLLSGETYDNGCATAIGAEAISRDGSGDGSGDPGPSTTPPTTPAAPRTAAVALGAAASTLPSTGSTTPLSPLAAAVAAAVAGLAIRRRLLAI